MNRNLLVRVSVPVTADAEGNNGRAGTAYPVATNMLLTAKHVVCPPDRDFTRPIEIMWDGMANKSWTALEGDDVVAWQHPTLDAALIRLSKDHRPTALPGFAGLSALRPTDHKQWVSAGFPDAGKQGSNRRSIGFQGTTYSMTEHADYFEIDVRVPPESVADYPGASGMPIFLEGRTDILGVVKELPRRFGGGKLHAVPCWKLMADAEFRRLIGADDRRESQKRFAERIDQVLSRSTMAVELLRRVSGLCEDAPDRDGVVRCLSELMDPQVAAAGVRKVWNAVNQKRAQSDSATLRETQAVLADLVMELVPYQSETHATVRLREQILGPDAIIAEIPCAFETVAEIFMAAAENRRAEYRLRRSDADYPWGVRSRPPPPLNGIDGVRKMIESVESDFNGKFLIGWADLRKKIDDIMAAGLIETGSGPELTEEEMISSAAIELETRSAQGRFYFLYRPPKNESARQELEAGLAELGNVYSSLVILKLTGDVKTSLDERRNYGDFVQILPKEG